MLNSRDYIPHITIGKSRSIDDINQIYEKSKSLLQLNYNANISTIYCKKIIKDLKGNTRLDDEIEFRLLPDINKIL